MNLDRTSIPERSQDLRTQKPQPNEATEQPEESRQSKPTTAPKYDGVLASSSLAKEPGNEQSPLSRQHAEQRRQEAYDAINRYLQVPGGTELDIQVDVEEEQVTFQIRDRDSGRLIREVPESESGSLVEKLRDYAGTLVNRSL